MAETSEEHALTREEFLQDEAIRVDNANYEEFVPKKYKMWADMPEDRIPESIKQLKKNTWVLGHFLLSRSEGKVDDAHWYDDIENSSYSLSLAPIHLLGKGEKLDSPHVILINGHPSQSVWTIGRKAFCKVQLVEEGVTPQSRIIQYVEGQQPKTFSTPRVIHEVYGLDRSYLFLERVPGQTLDRAWSQLSDTWRDHYALAVANAIAEMAEWKCRRIGGIDGRYALELTLTKPAGDFKNIQASCEAIGFDCTDLAFYHSDMGPTNLIIELEPNLGTLAIIDWESAAIYPRQYILTKQLLPGMLEASIPTLDVESSLKYKVGLALVEKGFTHRLPEFEEWEDIYGERVESKPTKVSSE